MKKEKLITLWLPACFIIMTFTLTFSNLNHLVFLDVKGLFVICLMFIFPLLFFVQGMRSFTTNTNILLALGVSALAFACMVTLYLNKSGYSHLLRYVIFGLNGYGIAFVISKSKQTKRT